jgi:aspartyl aminopeptidase
MTTPHLQPGAAVILDRDRAIARSLDLCRFIDAGPMPQLAAREVARRLDAAGYSALSEADAWALEPGAGYYVIRGDTTVVAFRVGAESPAEAGFRAFGAHLDSPNLRVKPVGTSTSEGYRRLAVEVYGGVLLPTWADRDLGLAGRVVIRDGDGLRTELIRIDRPIARVPNLAIHLNRGANEAYKLDKQRHMPPIIGLAGSSLIGDDEVRRLAAAEAGVEPEEIVDYDLGLFDVQPSTIAGVDGEFVFAPRLDNLGSSHAGLVALVESVGVAPSAHTSIIALYDHEECGSSSAQGAAGPFLLDVMRRITTTHPATDGCFPEHVSRALARSLMISADMAHAVHPNYGEMHEPGHRPRLNRGPVIKRNENQRYATDGVTGAMFTELCRAAGFEPQTFVVRSDLPCGSTIGPITAARAGIATVDVGNPMLSMHSVREMCGTFDQDLMVEALLRHFG